MIRFMKSLFISSALLSAWLLTPVEVRSQTSGGGAGSAPGGGSGTGATPAAGAGAGQTNSGTGPVLRPGAGPTIGTSPGTAGANPGAIPSNAVNPGTNPGSSTNPGAGQGQIGVAQPRAVPQNPLLPTSPSTGVRPGQDVSRPGPGAIDSQGIGVINPSVGGTLGKGIVPRPITPPPLSMRRPQGLTQLAQLQQQPPNRNPRGQVPKEVLERFPVQPFQGPMPMQPPPPNKNPRGQVPKEVLERFPVQPFQGPMPMQPPPPNKNPRGQTPKDVLERFPVQPFQPPQPGNPTRPNPGVQPNPAQQIPNQPPVNPAQPNPGTQPGNPARPAPGTQPANPAQPNPGTQPANPARPNPGTQPGDPAQPNPGTQPENPAEPKQPATKPNPGAQPTNPEKAPGNSQNVPDNTVRVTVGTTGSTQTGNQAPAAQPNTPANVNAPGTVGPNNGTSKTALNADVLVRGLVNVNADGLNANAGSLVNINTSLNNAQVQMMLRSLEGNVQAQTNAQTLTQRLQQGGLLQEGQRVIGFADGKVYITGAATAQP